ncbi:MAG: asparagine synthase (glutamine-hydrolyzing), partial [Gammaproteobacteria bacterium]
MCGIAGLLDFSRSTNASDLSTLGLKMADVMTHRGPDDHGVWVDPAVGISLAQRRLSIIDLAKTGHQPMASRDGRYVVVYNGEIYNHRALRAELESEGRTFRGHSDTQVITEGCSTWGFEAMLGKLNGMFAIALWDREARRLYFARDRMGEKPLYFGKFGHSFLFGSELKALLAHPACRPALSPDAASLYFRYNYIPGAHSIFTGVAKLRPGHMLCLELDAPAGEFVQTPYWSVAEAAEAGIRNPLPADPNAALEALEPLLDDAVKIRLESDVPIGALLSGGVDSSLIVALMRRHAGDRVKTFSVGFSEKEYDESAHARRVAEHLGTDHTEFHLTPEDALTVVPSLPTMYDEPFADSSQIPTFLISKLARQHVTVALSGDAGDELFAGYHRYAWGQALWNKMRLFPAPLRALFGRAMRICSPAQLDALARVAFSMLPKHLRVTTPGDRIHKLSHVISSPSQEALYDALLTNFSGHRTPGATMVIPVGGSPEQPNIDDFVSWMSALDMLAYLPDDILVKVDRATMATSLESRA